MLEAEEEEEEATCRQAAAATLRRGSLRHTESSAAAQPHCSCLQKKTKRKPVQDEHAIGSSAPLRVQVQAVGTRQLACVAPRAWSELPLMTADESAQQRDAAIGYCCR